MRMATIEKSMSSFRQEALFLLGADLINISCIITKLSKVIPELEIAASHWPFSDQFQDLTE